MAAAKMIPQPVQPTATTGFMLEGPAAQESGCVSQVLEWGKTAASHSLPTPSLLTPQQKDSPTNTASYEAVSLVRIRNSGVTQKQAEGLLKVLELMIPFYRLNLLLCLMTNSPRCF